MNRYIISAFAALAILASCNETDIDLFDSPLAENGSGTLASTGVAVSRLSFEWQPVEGVYQYGYTLATDGRTVRQGVTRNTSMRFDNLEPYTEYTLTVEAFGHNNAPTQRFSLTAKTNAIVKLDTPDTANATVSTEDGRFIITWPAVPNAEYYDYVLLRSDGYEMTDGQVTTNTIVFNTIPIGDYILQITAGTNQEGFLSSDTAEYAFSRSHQVVSEHTGTYTSAVLGAWQCTMKIYDDGAYVIEAFYGVEGYDLEFSLSRDNVISILNAFDSWGAYKYVATGLDGDDDIIAIYEDPSYCTYSVLPTGKRIRLYSILGDRTDGAYDQFVWK